MQDPESRSGPSPPDSLQGARSFRLEQWGEVWESDHEFPIRSHRRWIGWLIVGLKRAVRAVVTFAVRDLFDRQRYYNLKVHDRLVEQQLVLDEGRRQLPVLDERLQRLGVDLQTVQKELVADGRRLHEGIGDLQRSLFEHREDLGRHHERLNVLEGFMNEGIEDLRRHGDALFARVDQKLVRYREQSRELWSRLQAVLAAAEAAPSGSLQRAVAEDGYVRFEGLFRGPEREIGDRLHAYLGFLEGRAPVLDLGCGRGEALALLRERGIAGRGVDTSAEMVARCREKGLEAEEGDLFEKLSEVPEEGLGAVVSFHVIEHLPAESLDPLVRLAWRALRPGGVLILETPNPLSLVVAARNFWLDPSHRRPVHPDSLKLAFEQAGFDPAVQIDLQPFAAEERLPEIPLDGLPEDLRVVAASVNRLRDRLDELLFGYQDYGMVGFKP